MSMFFVSHRQVSSFADSGVGGDGGVRDLGWPGRKSLRRTNRSEEIWGATGEKWNAAYNFFSFGLENISLLDSNHFRR
ncbi:unnamed protein product [Calypogeia fissa]